MDYKRALLDAIIIAFFLMTAGGFYMTITHNFPPVFPDLAHFSYGMIAPYQKDAWYNSDLAVIGWDNQGRSSLVPVRHYFAGGFGEKNSRMRLEELSVLASDDFARAYISILSQIQKHESQQGREYVRLDLFWENWQRDPKGYEANRTKSTRTFITTYP